MKQVSWRQKRNSKSKKTRLYDCKLRKRNFYFLRNLFIYYMLQ